MASVPGSPVMKWWIGAGDAFRHCLPDDRFFIALLTAWVGLLVAVTYLLLGWASACVLIAVTAVFGLATIAAQSRQPRRPDRAESRS
jgi:hypothetical protein